ncbi:hypothetical protein CLOM_g1519 [Closterium sp. NIES-68]|nr:hypothetical protein CLOM_g1519 [Closterium sp. NIES-68]GJP60777.1 hypothetical protein CLOP_g18002 [Closterium sp. NIES-67]
MSSIYVLEPPTQGKVVVTTTLGDLDIELWPREAPKAVRNFVQLCLEGYYDNTIFHRIIPGFMVQGGDPTGSGTGGESIYGEPFKDEFHSRLRFSHRGLVACANASAPHSNGSQWFFTLDRCDWLDKKHTIFGKITGDTIFNAVRLGEVDTDDNDRPFDPPSIISVEVIWNPFEDIVPRRLPARQQLEAARKSKGRDKNKRRHQPQVKGTKQLNLLSFGEEAEEEEAQLEEANLRIRSSHDVLKDPRLLAETAEAVQQKLASRGGDSEGEEEEEEESGRREGERLSRGRDNGKEGDSAGGAIGSGRGRKGEEKGGKSGDRGGLGDSEDERGRGREGREGRGGEGEGGGEREGGGEGEEPSFDELMRRKVLEKQRRFLKGVEKQGGANEGGRSGEKKGRGGKGEGGETGGEGATRKHDGAGVRERAKEEEGGGGDGDSDGSDGSDEEGEGRGGKGRVRVEKLRLRKVVGKGGGKGGGEESAGGGLLGEEEERRQQMRQRKRALGSRQEKTLELLNRFKSKLTASKSVQQRDTHADKGKGFAADEGALGGGEEKTEGERGGDGSSRRGESLESGKKREAGAYGPGGKARQDVGGEGVEDDAEEGGGVDWMAHRLKFEVKRNKRDEMLRNEDPDQYAVHDPLLEKGKEKFNKMQAKAKKRNREWAGRSLD